MGKIALWFACLGCLGDARRFFGWYQNPSETTLWKAESTSHRLDEDSDPRGFAWWSHLKDSTASPKRVLATHLLSSRPAVDTSSFQNGVTRSTPTQMFARDKYRAIPSTDNSNVHRLRLSTMSETDLSSNVFCNREMALEHVDAVGFDMDHTLATYEMEFDLLAFEGAKHKLVESLGYPDDVLDFEFHPTRFMRGLVIDKRAGNILKIDRHKYVKVASHGTRQLKSKERKRLYRPTIDGTYKYSNVNFVKVDTQFLLVDADLFTQLVDLKDNNPGLIDKSYEQMFTDVRRSVDLAHRDGTIKSKVKEDPSTYIQKDPQILPMLKALKQAGKQVFLLTNSEWDYTNVVMNQLWGNSPDKRDLEWTSLFDIVICMAMKPSFLTDSSRPLYRIIPESNGLLEPINNIGKDITGFLAKGKVFQGGNYRQLHKMLSCSGERLLYVGDHMYADVTRTKRTLGWRTCLIIPELTVELDILGSNQDALKEIEELRAQQLRLDEELDRLRLDDSLDSEAQNEAIVGIEARQVDVKAKIKDACLAHHSMFHRRWGQLFKTGYQESLFAKQVATYACIYTSCAGNLRGVSPLRHFRPPVSSVGPHEYEVARGRN